jgi:hypothetical protein
VIEFQVVCRATFNALSSIALPDGRFYVLRDMSTSAFLKSHVNLAMVSLDCPLDVRCGYFWIRDMECLTGSSRLTDDAQARCRRVCGIDASEGNLNRVIV